MSVEKRSIPLYRPFGLKLEGMSAVEILDLAQKCARFSEFPASSTVPRCGCACLQSKAHEVR
jgi:hypothetical protein